MERRRSVKLPTRTAAFVFRPRTTGRRRLPGGVRNEGDSEDRAPPRPLVIYLYINIYRR
jgi:hypothetical protein